METIRDFEDMLELLARHRVRYLVVGGLAFIYHAKPRYTKDMDLWIEFAPENVERANAALAEFGSSALLSPDHDEEVLQLGIAPDRIDFFLRMGGMRFEDAWAKRIRGKYGDTVANWIDLDSLLAIKSAIDTPRHQEDARVLREVKKRR
ncbi:MAG: hypothetical protein M0R80_21510 [Proteobacteria bacterium]|nr:hypothetical protein [Pseudomonadota bacterium]